MTARTTHRACFSGSGLPGFALHLNATPSRIFLPQQGPRFCGTRDGTGYSRVGRTDAVRPMRMEGATMSTGSQPDVGGRPSATRTQHARRVGNRWATPPDQRPTLARKRPDNT